MEFMPFSINLRSKLPTLSILTEIWRYYCQIWNQRPRICLTAKSRVRTKKTFFCAATLNSYFHIWNQRPHICLIVTFCVKIKILKFGTENTWFWCFGQQIWKTIFIFKVSAPGFFQFQNFVQEQKCLNWVWV